MKTPIIGMILICASLSQAAVLFKPTSNLPKSAQAGIVSGIQQNCPKMSAGGWVIFELATDASYDSNASYFTSDFAVYSTAADRPQKKGQLKIQSVLSTPDPLESPQVQIELIHGFCQ